MEGKENKKVRETDRWMPGHGERERGAHDWSRLWGRGRKGQDSED